MSPSPVRSARQAPSGGQTPIAKAAVSKSSIEPSQLMSVGQGARPSTRLTTADGIPATLLSVGLAITRSPSWRPPRPPSLRPQVFASLILGRIQVCAQGLSGAECCARTFRSAHLLNWWTLRLICHLVLTGGFPSLFQVVSALRPSKPFHSGNPMSQRDIASSRGSPQVALNQ